MFVKLIRFQDNIQYKNRRQMPLVIAFASYLIFLPFYFWG